MKQNVAFTIERKCYLETFIHGVVKNNSLVIEDLTASFLELFYIKIIAHIKGKEKQGRKNTPVKKQEIKKLRLSLDCVLCTSDAFTFGLHSEGALLK